MPTATPASCSGETFPGDDELHLCGDVSDGKRTLELGVSTAMQRHRFRRRWCQVAGGRPRRRRGSPSSARRPSKPTSASSATSASSPISAFATSGSVEVVLANGTLEAVDDLGRLLRQVHRVLKPSRSFVIRLRHPFADVFQGEIATPVRVGHPYRRGVVHRPRTRQLPRRRDARARRDRALPGSDHASGAGPQGRFVSDG